MATLSRNEDEYLVIAVDIGTGSVVWRARYDAAGRVSGNPKGIVVSADGQEVVVTGDAGRPRSWGTVYATVAFGVTNGEQLWVKKYGFGLGANDHYVSAIAAAPQGGVYVTGESEGPTGWSDFATIRYS